MKTCPKCGIEYSDLTTLCPADGVALEKADDSLIGKTLTGKYRIDERLSEGGMGAVYRGTHVLMDKTVAVKVLRPALAADEKIVARFSREARAASRISHPHALSVTDFGEAEDGVVFLVMEYLSGKTLKQIIRDEGPLSLARTVEIMRQIGGALDAAHEQGVVHRDLKSDNIMLVSTNSGDYAKVLDFGIAKIKEPQGEYDPGLTAPDLVIGTPQYMSPEQCSQAPDIDTRSDIYSLGVILFEMLVGHVPFTGPSPTTIMLKQLQEQPPSVLDERTDLPPSVGTIVSRALAKLPENRYQTAGALVEDLIMAAGIEGPVNSASFPAVTNETVKATTAEVPVADDPDEITVVRPRTAPIAPTPPPPRPVVHQPPPQPRASFNPWKVLIPSMAGLLVVFAVIYAFTSNNEAPAVTPNEPALVADPNSQPVQPTEPATGRDEVGIPTGGSASTPEASPSVTPQVSPTPVEDVNENGNSNAERPGDNANTNSNNNRTPPLPSPTQRITTPPPPLPDPGTKPSPKPTTSAPAGDPPAPGDTSGSY